MAVVAKNSTGDKKSPEGSDTPSDEKLIWSVDAVGIPDPANSHVITIGHHEQSNLSQIYLVGNFSADLRNFIDNEDTKSSNEALINQITAQSTEEISNPAELTGNRVSEEDLKLIVRAVKETLGANGEISEKQKQDLPPAAPAVIENDTNTAITTQSNPRDEVQGLSEKITSKAEDLISSMLACIQKTENGKTVPVLKVTSADVTSLAELSTSGTESISNLMRAMRQILTEKESQQVTLITEQEVIDFQNKMDRLVVNAGTMRRFISTLGSIKTSYKIKSVGESKEERTALDSALSQMIEQAHELKYIIDLKAPDALRNSKVRPCLGYEHIKNTSLNPSANKVDPVRLLEELHCLGFVNIDSIQAGRRRMSVQYSNSLDATPRTTGITIPNRNFLMAAYSLFMAAPAMVATGALVAGTSISPATALFTPLITYFATLSRFAARVPSLLMDRFNQLSSKLEGSAYTHETLLVEGCVGLKNMMTLAQQAGVYKLGVKDTDSFRQANKPIDQVMENLAEPMLTLLKNWGTLRFERGSKPVEFTKVKSDLETNVKKFITENQSKLIASWMRVFSVTLPVGGALNLLLSDLSTLDFVTSILKTLK
jgi:hypothetical protein